MFTSIGFRMTARVATERLDAEDIGLLKWSVYL